MASVGASFFSFFARAPLGKQNDSEVAKIVNVLSQFLAAQIEEELRGDL